MRDAEPWRSVWDTRGDQSDRCQMAKMRESADCQRDCRMRPSAAVQFTVGAYDVKGNAEQSSRRLGTTAHCFELIHAIRRSVEAMDHHHCLDRDCSFPCEAKTMPYDGES